MNGGSAVGKQFFDGQADVAGNLPQQRRGDVAALVHRNSRAPAIGMAVLRVGTALAHERKAEAVQAGGRLRRV